MLAVSVPRRTVLRLGLAAITYSFFPVSSHASNDERGAALALSQEPTPAPALTQGVWLWQRSTYADEQTIFCADPRKYTLTFMANGLYNVLADCNQGSGIYTVSGSQLTLQPGPMTRAACPPDSQDTVFLRDLAQVAAYGFDGENLVLNLALDSGTMVFSPQPPVSLTGPAWQVLSVNNGRGAVVTVLPETQLDAMFGEDGIVSGNTGCNAYRALYTVTGQAIAIGTPISTRRACQSEAAGTQEQAFLAALSASSRYELSNGRLTMRNAEGATQVQLVRPMG
jgi:heat shock protein HslJ